MSKKFVVEPKKNFLDISEDLKEMSLVIFPEGKSKGKLRFTITNMDKSKKHSDFLNLLGITNVPGINDEKYVRDSRVKMGKFIMAENKKLEVEVSLEKEAPKVRKNL